MAIYQKLGLAVAVAGMAVALTGCGTPPVPLTKNFAESSQYKVRAAGHWDAMSRDVAARTRDNLARSGFNADAPLYVALPPNASAFDNGFRDLLITRLIDAGAKVQAVPSQQLEVTYNAQVVKTAGHANVGGYSDEPHSSSSNTEVILTTTVTNNGMFVSRESDVYYLANVDVPLFAKSTHFRPVNMKVVGQ
ncbi:hypothetical protein G7047_25825 [Diaphorobacter sp. HDW4A]|uniref:hypothetical protein n=1 Tax=Diaphorobacter sp. HDW4A TaxID=2714924 RepID=UPI001408DD88|nr:hypothetical protein [Diaphorobacter sp. HDW4A]QIL82974.1 hypothetical protein G7047_25825 [Diaphorobacter sp. HDW4A]